MDHTAAETNHNINSAFGPEKVDLKPNIQKAKIMASGSITSWQIDEETMQTGTLFLGLQNGLVGSPCSPRDSQESSPTPQFKSINSAFFIVQLSYPHITTG